MSLYDILYGDIMPNSGTVVTIGRNQYDGAAPVVPLLEIHQRSAVLHDSNSPASSGLVRYNGDTENLELIPGTSGARPVVTSVLFEQYESAGGSTISGSESTIEFDTNRVNTHPEIFAYDAALDELTVWAKGTYEVIYKASFDNGTTTRTSARFNLAHRSGGSWSDVTGSRSYSYHRTSSAGEDTATAKAIISDVEPGDAFRVRGIIIAGTTSLSQLANGSNFIVKRIA